MPLLPNDGDFVILVGGFFVVGDIAQVPRPEPVQGLEAIEESLGPIRGLTAVADPVLTPLTVTETIVTDALGYSVTLEVLNNPTPVHYTLDGSEPIEGTSPTWDPVVGLRIEGSPGDVITLKHKAFALPGFGFDDSATTTTVLTIPQAVDLIFDVENDSGGDPLKKFIEITGSIAGDYDIIYTTDGSAPVQSPLNGTVYSGEFQVTGSVAGDQVTIKAKAFPNQVLSPSDPILPSDLETVVVTF